MVYCRLMSNTKKKRDIFFFPQNLCFLETFLFIFSQLHPTSPSCLSLIIHFEDNFDQWYCIIFVISNCMSKYLFYISVL